MRKTITIDRELLYDTLGALQSYLLLIDEGIQQPNIASEIMQVRKLMADLKAAGNVE